MSEWISVSERLPEPNTLVLCVGKRGGMFLGEPRCIFQGDGTAHTYVPNSRGCRYTTHWMPLPEPPKEG